MKHVDMRELAERRRQPVQRKARLDQRQVERFPVVGHDRATQARNVGDGFQEHTLGRKVRQEELPHSKAAVLIPGAANEERIGAGAAGDAGGFEVDEEQVRMCGDPRVRGCACQQ